MRNHKRSRRQTLATFISVFVPLLAIAPLTADEPNQSITEKGWEAVAFKEVKKDSLHVYWKAGKTKDASSPQPAVVFFFGGGWKGGNAAHFLPQGEYLAERGVTVFLPTYRTLSSHKTAPNIALEDAKSAIRFIRRNAKEFNIDPDRIAVGGGSAGGHLAAATSMCQGFDAEGEDTSISTKADLLLLFNPVYHNGPEGYGHDRVKEWFPAISPFHQISKDTPDNIVFFGSEDGLTSVEQMREFKAKCESVGVASELHLYEGAKHGFFNPLIGRNPSAEFFIETLMRTDSFLQANEYLEGMADPELAARILKGLK